nr:hypothetical protein [Chromobacterium sp. ASV5]
MDIPGWMETAIVAKTRRLSGGQSGRMRHAKAGQTQRQLLVPRQDILKQLAARGDVVIKTPGPDQVHRQLEMRLIQLLQGAQIKTFPQLQVGHQLQQQTNLLICLPLLQHLSELFCRIHTMHPHKNDINILLRLQKYETA